MLQYWFRVVVAVIINRAGRLVQALVEKRIFYAKKILGVADRGDLIAFIPITAGPAVYPRVV